MAQIIVKKVLKGTNEEIQELYEMLIEKAQYNSELYVEQYGENFAGVDVEVFYDEEEKETPLQKHLRNELEKYRFILNDEAIEAAEELIAQAAESELTEEEVQDLENQSEALLEKLQFEQDLWLIKDLFIL